jgi:hypothetical protein
MKLRDYINQMDSQAAAAYASRCGIAESYLRIHVKYGSKDPSVSLLKSLTRESDGCVSLTEVLEHFGITDTIPETRADQVEKRRPKGRPVPPGTHHHSAVGSR